MKTLLDTHVLLWAAAGDSRLSGTARKILSDRSNVAYVSDVSVLEIVLKVTAGKLRLGASVAEFLEDERRANSYTPLPLLREHILRLEEIGTHHLDPFDRLLIAQAIEENLPILTRDPRIKQYPVETIW